MSGKKNRTKTQTQVSKQGVAPKVTVQVTNESGKKKKKARNVLSMPEGKGNYRLALLNPFSDKALGCRVPDEFYSPTATLALREVVSLANDASGTFDCILLPSVIVPAVSTRGSINNGSTLTYMSGAVKSNATIYNQPGALYGKVTNHRIVSWGARIRNTSPVTAAQGALTVALVPTHQRCRVPNNIPVGGNTASGTGATYANPEQWLQSMGLPYTGAGASAVLDTGALLDFPFHARYQGTQLAENTFEVHPKLVDGTGRSFRNSNDNAYGLDIIPESSAVYIQPGDASYILCDGWTQIAIGYTGGSASPGANTFEVELIYHIEGSPNVSSSTVFVTDSPVSVHDPMLTMLAQAALSSAPAFTRVAGAAMAAYRAFAA